jgi:hypothetical protein
MAELEPMDEDIVTLERATVRLLALDPIRLADLAVPVAERALAARRPAARRDLSPRDTARIRAALASGDLLLARLRQCRVGWAADLDRLIRSRLWASELSRPAPGSAPSTGWQLPWPDRRREW